MHSSEFTDKYKHAFPTGENHVHFYNVIIIINLDQLTGLSAINQLIN